MKKVLYEELLPEEFVPENASIEKEYTEIKDRQN